MSFKVKDGVAEVDGVVVEVPKDSHKGDLAAPQEVIEPEAPEAPESQSVADAKGSIVADANEDKNEDLSIPELPKEDIVKSLITSDGKVDMEAIEKLGLPKEVKELIESGIESHKRKAADTLYSSVGGKENYEAMMKWASSNLSAQERAEYNNLLQSNVKAASLAAKGIFAEYSKAGKTPSLSNVPQSGPVPVEGFRSHAEFLAAQRDPRYRSDPGFREQVLQRVSVSKWFNKN